MPRTSLGSWLHCRIPSECFSLRRHPNTMEYVCRFYFRSHSMPRINRKTLVSCIALRDCCWKSWFERNRCQASHTSSLTRLTSEINTWISCSSWFESCSAQIHRTSRSFVCPPQLRHQSSQTIFEYRTRKCSCCQRPSFASNAKIRSQWRTTIWTMFNDSRLWVFDSSRLSSFEITIIFFLSGCHSALWKTRHFRRDVQIGIAFNHSVKTLRWWRPRWHHGLRLVARNIGLPARHSWDNIYGETPQRPRRRVWLSILLLFLMNLTGANFAVTKSSIGASLYCIRWSAAANNIEFSLQRNQRKGKSFCQQTLRRALSLCRMWNTVSCFLPPIRDGQLKFQEFSIDFSSDRLLSDQTYGNGHSNEFLLPSAVMGIPQ